MQMVCRRQRENNKKFIFCLFCRNFAREEKTKRIMETQTSMNGDVLVPIGSNDKFATTNVFENKVYIHVRKYLKSAHGLVPQRKGIALTLDEFDELLDAAEDLRKKAVKAEKKLKRKAPIPEGSGDHKKSKAE